MHFLYESEPTNKNILCYENIHILSLSKDLKEIHQILSSWLLIFTLEHLKVYL